MKTATADARARTNYAHGNYHAPDNPEHGWERKTRYYLSAKAKAYQQARTDEERLRAFWQQNTLKHVIGVVDNTKIAKPDLLCWPNGQILMHWPNSGRNLWVSNQPNTPTTFHYCILPAGDPLPDVADLERWRLLSKEGYLYRNLPHVVRLHTGGYSPCAWFPTEHQKTVGPWTLTVRDDLEETDTIWTVTHQAAGVLAQGRASSRRDAQRTAQDVQERIARRLQSPGSPRSPLPTALRQAAASAA